jgi:predicted DNA-binding transcriptional regulator AlpA
MTTETQAQLLTAEQVAARLQVKPRTVSETWQRPGVTNGFPKCIWVGSRKRWRAEDIENWIIERGVL